MKAICLLLLFAFIYSIPNPVYTYKDCFDSIVQGDRFLNSNAELLQSAENDLFNWDFDKFYEKLDQIDTSLRPRIEDCVRNMHKKYKGHGFGYGSDSNPTYLKNKKHYFK